MKTVLITIAAALATVNAQGAFKFSMTYPPANAIPDVTSAQAKQWISQINMTAVPVFPLVPAGKDGSPGAMKSDIGSCDWTFNNCLGPTDIAVCPVGYWGLTYDDGPSQYSPTLYDALLKASTKATLFWIGSNVFTNPTVAQRACADGHQIAVHTWSHHPSTSLTNEQFIAEVKWTESAIKEVCGITPKYFRPPYGDIDNRIRGLLAQMGYVAVIWDIDTNDWQMPPGGTKTAAEIDTLFNGWIAANKVNKTGHICLEHEIYQTSITEAIKQLPNILANWKPMPVASCVNDDHPYVETNITFPTIANGMSNASAPANTSASLPASSVAPTDSGSSSPTGAANISSVNITGAAAPGSTVKKAAGSSLSVAPVVASLGLVIASLFLAL
jgi:peptidoglycan/xylan/chitin deacetylase (PgdA/CDA1 family)